MWSPAPLQPKQGRRPLPLRRHCLFPRCSGRPPAAMGRRTEAASRLQPEARSATCCRRCRLRECRMQLLPVHPPTVGDALLAMGRRLSPEARAARLARDAEPADRRARSPAKGALVFDHSESLHEVQPKHVMRITRQICHCCTRQQLAAPALNLTATSLRSQVFSDPSK
jgi:hypothetical protein